MASDTMPATGFFEKHRKKIAVGGPSECWPWTGAKDSHGYGIVWAREKRRKAHREAFEAVNGAGCADGLVVRHRCDNPPCVNPAHLERGTVADNNRDRDARGRAAKGAAHGSAKFTEAEVRAIRAECVPGSVTHGTRALARKHGVDKATLSAIIRRELWKHI